MARTLLLTLTVAAACKGAEPPPSPKTPTADTRVAQKADTRAPQKADAAVTRALADMRVRKRCNRVMGCPPGVRLFQHGRAAIPAILKVLERGRHADGYWVVKLLDYLGQLDDVRALPVLYQLLEDPRTEVHSRAAIALARLGKRSSRGPLKAALEAGRFPKDAAYRAALLWALSRVSKPDPRRRQEVLAAFPPETSTLGGHNPLALMLFADIAGEWPLPQAAPTLRLLARHVGTFVRRSAIRALMKLRDQGAVPVLVGRLDDKVPSVRKLALGALGVITGARSRRTPDEWKRWCVATKCRK
mgnify:CR=1 FL=1